MGGSGWTVILMQRVLALVVQALHFPLGRVRICGGLVTPVKVQSPEHQEESRTLPTCLPGQGGRRTGDAAQKGNQAGAAPLQPY